MSISTLTSAEYRAMLRLDFATFVEQAFREVNPGTEFIPGQYIELLADTLERVRSGGVKRLIINLPPRSLKSHAASVAFPAWLLGHDPSIQIICASYGQDLSNKHARDCRALMASDFYRQVFPRTTLSPTKNAVEEFETTAQGLRKATSVGGALTGRGGNFIILDDILKPEDALSETRRKAANDWYFSTLLSRLNSKEKGAIIIVMQRLHLGDLVGEVMDREPWEVLSLPAIAVADESYSYSTPFGRCIYSRKEGEALHPERDSADTYKKIRANVGSYIFQSQYQQNPASLEGGLIKKEWLRYYEHSVFPNDFTWILQSWDTAWKIGEANDYSVCTTWRLVGANFYLIDVFRARLSYPDLKRAVVDLYNKYQPCEILIENQSSGIALIEELKREFIYTVTAWKPEGGEDKYQRLAAESIKFEEGRILLPKQAEWVDEYIRELTAFPGAKHDDQVDSTTQALAYLTSKANAFAPFRETDARTIYPMHYPYEYS